MSTTFTEKQVAVDLSAGNISSATWNTVCHIAGAAFDNTGGLATHIDIEVLFQLAATAVAGAPLNFFLLAALDGTNYEDGIPSTNDGTAAASPPPDPGRQVASIGALADTNAHRIVREGIPIGPYKYRLVAYNGTTKSQATSSFAVNIHGVKRQETDA